MSRGGTAKERANANDASLREAVEIALGGAPGVPADAIGVTVEDGVVRLDGEVASHRQKRRAAETVWATDGVRGLVQGIDVRSDRPDGSDDDDVMRAVLDALDAAPSGRTGTPRVTLQNGWAVLHGPVANDSARRVAVDAIGSVSGVRGVVDRRRAVQPGAIEAVRSAVRAALRERAAVGASRIRTRLEGDTLVLSGRIDSEAERRIARAAAVGLPGVEAVLDEMEG